MLLVTQSDCLWLTKWKSTLNTSHSLLLIFLYFTSLFLIYFSNLSMHFHLFFCVIWRYLNYIILEPLECKWLSFSAVSSDMTDKVVEMLIGSEKGWICMKIDDHVIAVVQIILLIFYNEVKLAYWKPNQFC
jgi:hypothetical protein